MCYVLRAACYVPRRPPFLACAGGFCGWRGFGTCGLSVETGAFLPPIGFRLEKSGTAVFPFFFIVLQVRASSLFVVLDSARAAGRAATASRGGAGTGLEDPREMPSCPSMCAAARLAPGEGRQFWSIREDRLQFHAETRSSRGARGGAWRGSGQVNVVGLLCCCTRLDESSTRKSSPMSKCSIGVAQRSSASL